MADLPVSPVSNAGNPPPKNNQPEPATPNPQPEQPPSPVTPPPPITEPEPPPIRFEPYPLAGINLWPQGHRVAAPQRVLPEPPPADTMPEPEPIDRMPEPDVAMPEDNPLTLSVPRPELLLAGPPMPQPALDMPQSVTPPLLEAAGSPPPMPTPNLTYDYPDNETYEPLRTTDSTEQFDHLDNERDTRNITEGTNDASSRQYENNANDTQFDDVVLTAAAGSAATGSSSAFGGFGELGALFLLSGAMQQGAQQAVESEHKSEAKEKERDDQLQFNQSLLPNPINLFPSNRFTVSGTFSTPTFVGSNNLTL